MLKIGVDIPVNNGYIYIVQRNYGIALEYSDKIIIIP